MNKNKLFFILIFVISIICLLGCENKESKNNQINNKEETPIKKYESKDWNCEIALSDIKTIKGNSMMNIQPNMFISKDGSLYQFSLDKKYTNEQNCKKVESDTSFSYFNMFPNDRNLSLIVDNNNNFYYYEKELIKFSDYSTYHYDDTISFILKYPINYVSYSFKHIENAGSAFDNYYVENNTIYEVLSYWKDGETQYEQPIIVHQFLNEEILSVEGKIFKTDKAYYKIGITNEEKCNQYEDVECISGLVKIEDISNDYSNIEYFNGDYIIYKNDNKLYMYSSY